MPAPVEVEPPARFRRATRERAQSVGRAGKPLQSPFMAWASKDQLWSHFFGHMRLVSETRLFGFQLLLNAQARRLSASWRRWIMAAEKPEQNGKQRPPPVKLSTLSVVYERGDAAPLLDDPLIHCQAGQQLVLAFVLRNALMDYFGALRRTTNGRGARP